MIKMLRIYSKGFLGNVMVEELIPMMPHPLVMKSVNFHLSLRALSLNITSRYGDFFNKETYV